MNIDNVEGLQYSDILSLYDDIAENYDLISPHWCCYIDRSLLMDWDYNAGWNPQAPVHAIQGQRTFGSNGHWSNGWGYTHYLCNHYCHRTCTWQGYSC